MSLTDGMYKQEEGFDDNTSLEVLKKAFELGVTLLNTANFYSGGKNEALIGESLDGEACSFRRVKGACIYGVNVQPRHVCLASHEHIKSK